MTRINLTIHPRELSNIHLMAEYRELPRVFAVSPHGAPELPCLGPGHVKWCATKPKTMAERHAQLVAEMLHRGFAVSFPNPPKHSESETWTMAELDAMASFDIALKARILDRIRTMKRRPTWTNRDPPSWVQL